MSSDTSQSVDGPTEPHAREPNPEPRRITSDELCEISRRQHVIPIALEEAARSGFALAGIAARRYRLTQPDEEPDLSVSAVQRRTVTNTSNGYGLATTTWCSR